MLKQENENTLSAPGHEQPTMTCIKTPQWPAVIQHRDDPELSYVKDLEQWTGDADLCEWRYDDEDRLIDSKGECFSLAYNDTNRRTTFEWSGSGISVEEFARLVQAHMFALAQTCVSKVELRDYADGFVSLAMLDD